MLIADQARSRNWEGLEMDIDDATYSEIEALIHSDESPVGIDAKKTHVLILHKLISIEKRLDALDHAG